MSTPTPLVVADRYRLVAPLGQGGMGRVWRATDVVLHRDVAIKELVPPPGLTPDERREMRERSLREARAIARLNNINVVRVFDVLRTDADPWIVMEYVPSRSLQDTLASDGPVQPVRAAEIGLGVLNALRAAHRNGVMHRDVKPGNVLLGEEGRVVLTDFGLATVPGDPNVTRTGLVLGSPAYIAPERARDGTAGPAADLWSLGATLYAAVEGASPFARPTAIATLAALATENPPPARNAGPLKPVLNGLLRKDPTHRINAEEAERLLLRSTGRRSRMAFPMSPTMRRPGAGRERPAVPNAQPPVIPGHPGAGTPRGASGPAASGPASSGSAPVVPGPRPPVSTGRPPGTPVFIPGKATVGSPARPAAETPARADGPNVEPQRFDATRMDTPPVSERGLAADQDKSISGTSGASPKTTGQRGERATSAPASASASGALARGTRGAYGTIPADEVAAPDLDKPAESRIAESSRDTDERSRPTPAAAETPAPVTGAPAASVTGDTPAGTAEGEAGTGAEDARAGSAGQAPAGSAEQAPAEATEPAPAGTAEQAPTGTAETKAPITDDGAGASTADAQPAAEADGAESTDTVARRANKPAVGARAGTTGSKASRRKGRGRGRAADRAAATKSRSVTTGTNVSAAGPAAADAEHETPAEGAGKPSKATEAEEPAKSEAASTTAGDAKRSEANAAVVELIKATPSTGKPSPPPKKVAAARSTERRVTTAAISTPKPTGPTSTDSAAGTAVINVPVAQTSGTSAFTSPPSRPPWQPMAVPRRDEPKRGVTVLGTTLTRRQTAAGVAVLLAVLLALVLLVPRAFSGNDDNNGGDTAAPNPSAAQTGTTSAPAAPPAASTKPKTTPPTSAPAKKPAPAADLPDGWYLYTDRSGFSVPLPDGVRPSGSGNELRFRWNDRLLIIAQTGRPKPDPYQDWVQQERDRAGDQYNNYRRISLKRVDYQKSAADWEFTYTTGSGNAQHAVKRNFLTSDTQAYSINWYTSPGDWNAAKKDIQLIYQGFKPRR